MAMTRATIQRVELSPTPLERYRPLLGDDAFATFRTALHDLAAAADGRVVWNVNSTGRGGGVAELLGALIPYDMAAGVDERWVVIEGSPEFFAVTKKIHTLLHGVAPDGGRLSTDERRVYEETLAPNASALLEVMSRGDVALLHDPQTAGLVPALTEHGIKVVWRCHIGVDEPDATVRETWRVLSPYLSTASAVVFSREAYVWEGCDRSRVRIIAPCIDPFTSKNRDLGDEEVRSVLAQARVIEPVPASARFVMQVSRWDRLKDPVGVLRMFAHHVAQFADGWLVLAGPQVTSVADDPEQPEILAEVQAAMETFDRTVRDRIVIAQIPMRDLEANALIVNALQRRASVVLQKSVAEGFGLTVAEAMWKSRPVVASRVGGIEDQIQNGKNGLLIDDPMDLPAFGSAVVSLLADPQRAAELGRRARERVISDFLAPRHLVQQAELVSSLL
jgi:trehalose synthase